MPGFGVALHVLVVLTGAMAVGWAGGRLARLLKQPSVIGEIGGGLAVLPLIALLDREWADWLVPAGVTPFLQQIAHAGLALFLLGIGAELRRTRGAAAPGGSGWVAAGAVVPSLIGGIGVGVVLLPDSGSAVQAAAFLLFIAVAFVVTALPVLVRVLDACRLRGTAVGKAALGVAVLTDLVSWCGLTFALAMVDGAGRGWGWTLLAVVVAGCGGVGVNRLARAPWSRELCERMPRLSAVVLAVVVVSLAELSSAAGLTGVLVAIVLGYAISSGASDRGPAAVADRVAAIGRHTIPVYFVVTGLTLSLPGTVGVAWGLTAALFALLVLTKTGGTYAGARLARWPTPDARRLAVLMNTRGLTEVVLLQVGLVAGLINDTIFLAFLMASLAATACTAPLLGLINRRGLRAPG
ncbi:cation:proton antiporter [Amycolatopsis magusensis]|uniref:cation:proton antiporter n=1 Tax=Amycolatopsis magusensis TaxID=882444 RepID=UPI003C2FA042